MGSSIIRKNLKNARKSRDLLPKFVIKINNGAMVLVLIIVPDRWVVNYFSMNDVEWGLSINGQKIFGKRYIVFSSRSIYCGASHTIRRLYMESDQQCTLRNYST